MWALASQMGAVVADGARARACDGVRNGTHAPKEPTMHAMYAHLMTELDRQARDRHLEATRHRVEARRRRARPRGRAA